MTGFLIRRGRDTRGRSDYRPLSFFAAIIHHYDQYKLLEQALPFEYLLVNLHLNPLSPHLEGHGLLEKEGTFEATQSGPLSIDEKSMTQNG